MIDDSPALMTPEEFAEAIRYWAESRRVDTETSHIEMDKLLCKLLRSLGYGDAVDIFESASKWYA